MQVLIFNLLSTSVLVMVLIPHPHACDKSFQSDGFLLSAWLNFGQY